MSRARLPFQFRATGRDPRQYSLTPPLKRPGSRRASHSAALREITRTDLQQLRKLAQAPGGGPVGPPVELRLNSLSSECGGAESARCCNSECDAAGPFSDPLGTRAPGSVSGLFSILMAHPGFQFPFWLYKFLFWGAPVRPTAGRQYLGRMCADASGPGSPLPMAGCCKARLRRLKVETWLPRKPKKMSG